MVGGPCDNPGRVAERKLQRMTPTTFNWEVNMIICELTDTVCQHCTINCKHAIKDSDKKGDKNDNSKTVCGTSEKP